MENDTLTRTPSGSVNKMAKKMEMARRFLAHSVPEERVGKENLYLTRHDIRFETVAPGRVHIEVTVHNRGDRASKPTQAILRSAPFGAFLAWTPLTKVNVPSIPPGGELVVEVDAGYKSNERFNWLSRLFAPLTGNKKRPFADGSLDNRLPQAVPSSNSGLLSSFLKLVEETENWIGNIDIHVNGAYAEKHCAQGRLAYAGLNNRAVFFVGDGRSDQYHFEKSIQCREQTADWDIKLTRADTDFRMTNESLSRPITMAGVIIDFTPPAGVNEALLEVAVTRASTGAKAVVEFQVSTP